MRYKLLLALTGAAVAAVAVGAAAPSGGGRPAPIQLAAAAQQTCTMAGSQPDSGTISLKFLRRSTQNSDRNDYLLTSTFKWNSQAALECFQAGVVDWAYEQNITYGTQFDRKIWGEQTSLPAAARFYLDTTVSDRAGITGLDFGAFRPDKLIAGNQYAVSYRLLLPNNPPNNAHSFYVVGEVLERNCSKAGPWCVGLRGPRHSATLAGYSRTFDAYGSGCWAWAKGRNAPVSCGSTTTGGTQTTAAAPPIGGGEAPAKPATVTLARGPAAPSGYRYAITISGFNPNATVTVTCHDSVDPGGFYALSLRTDGGGNVATATQCYSGDHPDHWVRANGIESNHVTW
ncbi:hypothetical protein [Micromonospora inaquosa]|uniref:Uncharacterized protein n=1 Tax=Micromonospora inaquosa TaxID=2203716 RepID=A0A3N9WYJ8_9ACTN|nr:hypothetical protein [Micromonospora inaquosa]RQX05921.1 hypothetical protein DLJ59_06335 [Micromonospora inaquosa]